MKTLSEYTELRVPDYALSYLVNGDSSGIEESDVKAIDGWMQQFYDEAKEKGGHVIFGTTNSDDEGYFTHNPEFGLACNVVDCTILIVS
jgi:hypothetical protein